MKGSSNCPIERIKGLVACLAEDFGSLDELLASEDYFDAEPLEIAVSDSRTKAMLEEQFTRSKQGGGGFFGLFR